MRQVVFACRILGVLMLGSCTYGAAVDRSAIQAVLLLSDERTVVLAYQELLYQPAEGVAAFPDGGAARSSRSHICFVERGVDLINGRRGRRRRNA